jgi:hypothetical protein
MPVIIQRRKSSPASLEVFLIELEFVSIRFVPYDDHNGALSNQVRQRHNTQVKLQSVARRLP